MSAEQMIRQLRGEGLRMMDCALSDQRASFNKYLQAVKIYKQQQEGKAAPAVPPPPLPPPADPPEQLSVGQPAHLPSGSFGCSKCRWSETGCLQCNPAKATLSSGKAQA